MLSATRNTHWKVEAPDADAAVEAAKALAAEDGHRIERVGHANPIPAQPGWWFVTLSTERLPA